MISLKKAKKGKTIHAKIFTQFSIFMLLIIGAFLILFGTSFSSSLLENEYNNMRFVCDSISKDMDQKVENAVDTGIHIVTSNQVKKLFFSANSTYINQFITAKELRQTVRSITGLTELYPSITLIRKDNYVYEFSRMYNFGNIIDIVSLEDYEHYKSFRKNTINYISLPRTIKIEGSEISKVLTIYIPFAEKLNTIKDNTAAISIDYNKFMENITNTKKLNGKLKHQKLSIYVFNRDGQRIYPLKMADEKEEVSANEFYMEATKQNNISDVVNEKKGLLSSQICIFEKKAVSGFTTLVVKSKQSLMEPMFEFILKLLVVGMIIIGIALFVTYLLSRSLVKPIHKLRDSIKEFQLDYYSKEDYPMFKLDHSVDEMEVLSIEYNKMRERLNKTLSEIILAQSHELNSRLMALQAQMNPHFMYNTLTVMSILAEEEGSYDIMEMCNSLSGMLRYISTDSWKNVYLKEELDHVDGYIKLMKIRYQDMLFYECTITKNMEQIKIPRLIIQPFIENCIKYATNIQPPWKIKVEGIMIEDRWEICITDNGTGFTDLDFCTIKNQFKKADLRSNITQTQSKGVGLLNIYIRLKLLYNEHMKFELSNQTSGGACIVIGGKIL